MHGASSAQNSVDLEKDGVQVGGDLHQESCTSHNDFVGSLSEHNHIAAMFERMRSRISS